MFSVSLGSSTVSLADAHVHVQRLVSVIKIATVLEVHTTEDQNFVLRFFLRAIDSMQRIFIKTCFLCTVGSDCRVKRFPTAREILSRTF
jgi:hypothetical protein